MKLRFFDSGKGFDQNSAVARACLSRRPSNTVRGNRLTPGARISSRTFSSHLVSSVDLTMVLFVRVILLKKKSLSLKAYRAWRKWTAIPFRGQGYRICEGLGLKFPGPTRRTG